MGVYFLYAFRVFINRSMIQLHNFYPAFYPVELPAEL